MKKWIFSFIMIVALPVAASTTRVGNGDEGGDLEGATLILSGPILESRLMAINTLKALNISGIEGLGFVLPEVEHTKLLMAKSDVRHMSNEGEWESSPDREKAFARTFAEPHAPTRFFPAALKLTKEQLVALHIHEALHRALPAGIREDEEKVSMLTLAMTSPYATFDRVNRMARMTFAGPAVESRTESAVSSSSTLKVEEAMPRLAHRPQISFEHSSYFSEYGETLMADKMGLRLFSGYHVSALHEMFEPVVSLDGYLVTDYRGAFVGPVSFNLKASSVTTPGLSYGPFTQVSLRGLEQDLFIGRVTERDVYTLGFFHEQQRMNSYNRAQVSYTLPDSIGSKEGRGAIWSFSLGLGAKRGKFDFGLMGALHHSLGKRAWEAFTLLQAGPELKWASGRTTIKLGGGTILNRSLYDLSDLADLPGHGAGKTNVTASLSLDI